MLNPVIDKLDKWLDTTRDENGYAGPVSHWWDSSFLYTGVQIDWRYEGIVCGYVNFYSKTKEKKWLDKAIRAGDDCVRLQLPTGKFLNSNFQKGAIEGGTPHEAGVDVGLLELAKVLKKEKNDAWKKYFLAAQKNINKYLIGELWSGSGFKEQVWDSVLVPNKNATVIEALLLYQDLSGESMEKFVIPSAEVILRSQIAGGSAAGGIIHQGTHKHQISFGIYTARCVSGLLRLNQYYPNKKYIECAKRSIEYLEQLVNPKGSYLGYYNNDKLIKCPNWVSPSGDIVRAFALAQKNRIDVNQKILNMLVKAIINGQDSSGGIMTAYGFAKKGSTKDYFGVSEKRDTLCVVGWCDKVLRGFSYIV